MEEEFRLGEMTKQKWIVGYHYERIFIVFFMDMMFLLMGIVAAIHFGLGGLIFILMSFMMCYLWTRTHWYHLYTLYHTKEEYEDDKRWGLVD